MRHGYVEKAAKKAATEKAATEKAAKKAATEKAATEKAAKKAATEKAAAEKLKAVSNEPTSQHLLLLLLSVAEDHLRNPWTHQHLLKSSRPFLMSQHLLPLLLSVVEGHLRNPWTHQHEAKKAAKKAGCSSNLYDPRHEF